MGSSERLIWFLGGLVFLAGLLVILTLTDVLRFYYGNPPSDPSVQAMIDKLKTELESEKAAKSALEQQVSTLNDQITNILSDTSDSQRTIIELQSDIQALQDEVASKSKQLNDLRASTESTRSRLQRTIDDLQKQIITKNQEIANLKQQRTQNPPSTPQPSSNNCSVGGRNADLLFCDNFDNGQKNNWSPTSGSWVTRSKGYTITNTDLGQYYSFLPMGENWQNYAIDVDVNNITNLSRFAVLARASGKGNFGGFFYTGSRRPTDLFGTDSYSCIFGRLGEQFNCNQVKGDLPQNIHLRIEVLGNKIRIRLNNVYFDEMTGGFPNSGMPALFIGATGGALTFDNFQVQAISRFS